MNLFVTGGTGFFGKALLRYWQNNHPIFEKMYFLSRSPDTFLENYSDLVKGLPIDFVKGDILNLSKVNIDQDLDVILHAATDSTIGPTMGRLDVYHQITHGSEEVLKFATIHNCKKFVLTSSGGVYGVQPPHLEKIPEDYLGMPDPLDPNSAYGIGKRAAEHLTALYADKYKFDYVIARCFAFVGEDLPLDKHFAVGNFILNSLNKEKIMIKSDGSAKRSYLYQEDLAFLINYLCEKKCKYKVYNVGAQDEISIKELAYLVRNTCDKKIEVEINKKSNGSKNNRYIPDTRRIRDLVYPKKLLETKKSVEETIKKILKH